MRVLRSNKDSVMAMLEAFVYDPLINWRLVKTGEGETDNALAAMNSEMLPSNVPFTGTASALDCKILPIICMQSFSALLQTLRKDRSG